MSGSEWRIVTGTIRRVRRLRSTQPKIALLAFSAAVLGAAVPTGCVPPIAAGAFRPFGTTATVSVWPGPFYPLVLNPFTCRATARLRRSRTCVSPKASRFIFCGSLSKPFLPPSGVTACVKTSKDKGIFINDPIEKRIRKSPQQQTAGVRQDHGGRARRRRYAPDLTINFCDKCLTKTCAAGGVPVSRLDDIKAGGWQEENPNH